MPFVTCCPPAQCPRCSRRGLVSKRMLYALLLIQVANLIAVTTLDPNLLYGRFNFAHDPRSRAVASFGNITALSRSRARLPYLGYHLSTRRQLIISPQPSVRYLPRQKSKVPRVHRHQQSSQSPYRNLTSNKHSRNRETALQRTAPDSK